MTIKFIHLSDLHLKTNWEEQQGVVISKFLEDLKAQTYEQDNCYIIFSGDVVQSGSNTHYFDFFKSDFAEKLSKIGFNKDKLIFSPGNHDLDRDYTKRNFLTLKGLQERPTDESTFNDIIYGELADNIGQKFTNFLNWNKDVSDFHLTQDDFAGGGFSINEDFGIYCLNTSLYAFGGLEDETGQEVSDYGMLPVETRKLNKWLQNTKHTYRILVMHHPVSWLVPWAKVEVNRVIKDNFDLVLSGHTHEGESLNKFDGSRSVIECVAPPLFTRKNEELGYSIITVDSKTMSTQITYRQWFKTQFLSGVGLAGTETGIVQYQNIHSGAANLNKSNTNKLNSTTASAVEAFLDNKFSDSLNYHRSLPKIWIDLSISDIPESTQSNKQSTILSVSTFAKSLTDCIIDSPPQFGLSPLGRFIAKEVWKNSKKYVLFIKTDEIKNYESAIKKTIRNHLMERSLDEESLHAIILDEHKYLDERKINNIKKAYPDVPLIILNRVDDQEKIGHENSCDIDHSYTQYFLWSLNRHQVREVVSKFVEQGYELNEDESIQHLADDLENLNLHRTILNCSMMLAVHQQQMDSTCLTSAPMEQINGIA